MNHFDPQTEGEVTVPRGNEPTSGAESGSFGQRLCAAREARGWSRAEVAAKLKLPLGLVGKLESDDYQGLTEGVFLAGYLASYARLVDIPTDEAASVAASHSRLAPLVATGTVSRSRYLLDRYSVSATYLILTAIIVVPAVWLATHGGLEQNLARTTPLDPPVSSIPLSTQDPLHADSRGGESASDATAPETSRNPLPAAETPALVAAPAPVGQQPVVASMTPFTTAPTAASQPPAVEAPAPVDAAIGSGSHALTLKLSEASWVEIFGENGQRLEYSMLPAGTERNYRSNGDISVRLGNAQGAQVRSDGQLIELAPFQRGNVAYLKLSAGSARRAE